MRQSGKFQLAVGIVRFDIPITADVIIIRIRHADFLALIDVRRSPQEMDCLRQHGGCLERIPLRITESAVGSRLIMIVPEQCVPSVSVRHPCLPLIQNSLQFKKIEWLIRPFFTIFVINFQMVETENHREFVSVRIRIKNTIFDSGRGHLADRDDILQRPERCLVQLTDVLMDDRSIRVEALFVASFTVDQRDIFAYQVQHIEAEALDALFQPEIDDFLQFLAHFRVAPVQIRLRDIKQMQIVLAGVPEWRPRLTAEFRTPVGRQAAVCFRIADDVIILVLFVPGQRFPEPLMCGRCMIEHHVEHNFDAMLLQLADQFFKIRHRAENRIDGIIISDVVSIVPLRGYEDRIHPNHIDA